ncbi:hypothetical protein FQN57_002875 [Myotisia sp. PD_48]|nr:hypothetical protein FQN57_002875 [Myotisia sp. PD_48]
MVSRVYPVLRNNQILAFCLPFPSNEDGPVEPTATFPNIARDKTSLYAVSTNLTSATYTTRNNLVCIDRNGKDLWTVDLNVPEKTYFNGNSGSEFSRDGRVVWLYKPDQAYHGRAYDTVVALDAKSGEVLASSRLSSAGHGAEFHAPSDTNEMFLAVYEGQDGCCFYKLRLESGSIETVVFNLEGGSTYVLDVSLESNRFLTVCNGITLSICSLADGEVLKRVKLDRFGSKEAYEIESWVGGYLDDNIAVVSIRGETEDEEVDGKENEISEWNQYHLVNVHTGEVLGPPGPRTLDVTDILLLHDGSWLDETDGKFYRRVYRVAHTRE